MGALKSLLNGSGQTTRSRVFLNIFGFKFLHSVSGSIEVTMASTGKRKAFSIEEKIKFIRKLESGESQSTICKEFSLSKSTVATIWKNRESINSAYEKNKNGCKKLRKAERENVDDALLKWFTLQRSRNLPITGAILQAKANEFAELFDEKGFVCSNGWLDRFKKRNNINCGKIVGEAAGVCTSDVAYWIENVWPDIISNYDEKDIFNADEAGLFYKMTPNQTLKQKGEKCVGGKLSKVRITVLVCANMNGSEKQKLTVIGKSQKPRCFKNVKKLPVVYKANKKAWMTSELFQEFLRQWDKELSQNKRKIVLLIDNCTAHIEPKNLQWIKLAFLPPNTTSVLQPMDQGVIRSLKCIYRKQLILRILECYDKNTDCDISLFDAIVLLEKSWRMVTDSTIRNCFRNAGLEKSPQEEEESDDDDDNLPISKWLEKHGVNVFSEKEIEHFECCDDDVVTSGEISEEEIVTFIKEKNNSIVDPSSDIEEEEVDVTSGPSIADAKAAVNILNNFFATENIDKCIMDSFERVDKKIADMYLKSKSFQPKITSYFQNMDK